VSSVAGPLEIWNVRSVLSAHGESYTIRKPHTAVEIHFPVHAGKRAMLPSSYSTALVNDFESFAVGANALNKC